SRDYVIVRLCNHLITGAPPAGRTEEAPMTAHSPSVHYLPAISERRVPFRRILLVNPPMASIGAEFMMEDVPLRLEYLASYVRTDVDVIEVLDLANVQGSLPKAIKKYRPDLVGISINYISTHANGLKLAEVARAAGIPVVLGGYHSTAMADDFTRHPAVDF